MSGAATTRAGTWVVIGVGNTDRGDDAVGPVVARRVGELDLPGVDVVAQADPTGLLDLLDGTEAAVLVDAVRGGRPPGTVVVLEAGVGAAPLPADAWDGARAGGTHALGLADALELARALGRLPHRLVVVGIEARGDTLGDKLSPPVATAVEAAVTAVTTALGTPARRRPRGEQ